VTLPERARQREFLDQRFADSLRKSAQVVLVSGAAGSGKTHLLHSFGEQAGARGAQVLSALGTEAERDLPLGVLGQLLARFPEPGMSPDPPAAQTAEGRMTTRDMERLVQRISLAATERAVVICVDDIQYADAASLEFLQYLMLRIRSAELMLVFSESEHQPDYAPSFRVSLLRHPQFHRIRLDLLTRIEMRRLLDERLGPGPAAELSKKWWAMSGGNLLLVRALMDDHITAAGESGRPVGSASYGQAVLACLHSGTAEMRDAARALAVLGDAGSPAFGRLSGTDPDAMARGAGQLAAVGLVDHGWFRHPAIGTVVLSELSDDERRRLHHDAARLLYDSGAPVTDVAGQLVAAEYTDAGWAPEILRMAAKQALGEDRHQPAVTYLNLALRACRDTGERAATRAVLALAERRLNPAFMVRHLTSLIEAVRLGLLSPQCCAGLVRAALRHGRRDDALTVLEALREQVCDGDIEAAAQLRVLSSWIRVQRPGMPVRVAPPKDDSAIDLLAPGQRAADVLLEVLTRGGSERAVEHAEQILQSAYLDDSTIETIESALLSLIYSDRCEQAAQICDALLAEAAVRRVPMWRAVLAAARAEIAFRLGDLRQAETHGQMALGHISHRGWGVDAGWPVATVVLAQTAMGRFDAAEDMLAIPMLDALFETRAGLHYLYARGVFRQGRNHLDSALADFLACGDLAMRWGLDVPGLVPWRSAAASVLLRLGNAARARALMEEQLTRSRPRHPRSRGMTLRVYASAGEPQRRPALLREAVEALGVCGDQLELARALAELGLSYRELGEPTRARTLLDQASQLADRCAAKPMRRRLIRVRRGTANEPRPVLKPKSVPAGEPEHFTMLTGAEGRVAQLAALGYSNREIADKLFVTVSTVEQHLTRVYRKLRVNRRTDLPMVLQPTAVETS
jgi:tetratricopeptide (TPR) repeat protein